MPDSRRQDLIYLNVPDPEQPFGFNPLEGVPPLRRSLAANGIVEAMKKLFDDAWGVRLEYILRSVMRLSASTSTTPNRAQSSGAMSSVASVMSAPHSSCCCSIFR